MSGIQTCFHVGNLTRDPELNDSGMVLSFSIAVNSREKNTDGEYEERPNFYDFKVLGKRAQPLAGILTKGMKVAVQSDMRQERWEDKESGKGRSAVRMLVRELEFMSKDSAPSGGNSEPAGNDTDDGGDLF